MSQPQGAAQMPADDQNYAAERGGQVPGAATPTPPGAAPSPTSGSETPPPEGVGETAPPASEPEQIVTGLAEFFRAIKKIKGEVWLCGMALTGDVSGGLQVFTSDPNDKQTIVNALANDEELEVIVADEAVDFLDAMPKTGLRLEVTPGTNGVEIEEAGEEETPAEPPPEEMPPEAGPPEEL